MSSEVTQVHARRVVTGVGPDGRSTIVEDRFAQARIERPGGATVTELWRNDQLPASCHDSGPLAETAVRAPAAAGLAVRICTFPPDSSLDQAAFAAYAASMKDSYGDDAAPERSIPGLHQTDTVDVLTVLSGELWLVTENGETALQPGDSVVQRGTTHAWSNRGDATTTVLAIMMGAVRDGES